MYEYKLKVERVVDGDTVDASVDLGFSVSVRERFRLAGIDAPETRTTDLLEKAAGLATKAWLEEQLKAAKVVIGQIEKTAAQEKYGRWLVVLVVDGRNLNQEMISLGLVKAYDGGARG